MQRGWKNGGKPFYLRGLGEGAGGQLTGPIYALCEAVSPNRLCKGILPDT